MFHVKTIGRLTVLQTLVTQLADTSSNIEKRNLIVEALTGPKGKWIARVFRVIHDPYRNHYLRSESVGNPGGTNLHAGSDFMLALDALATKAVTGNDARAMWQQCRNELPRGFTKLIDSVLDRDLGVRVGVAEVNKAFVAAGLEEIPEFSVALGVPYEADAKGRLPDLFAGGAKWVWSRKYDGLRCIIILHGGPRGGVEILTRTGKTFTTLRVLTDYAARWKGEPVVLDGEVALANAKGEDDFKGILKQWSRKDHTIENPRFYAFDAIPYAEFIATEGETPFGARQPLLKEVLDVLDPHRDNFVQVEQTPVSSVEEVEHAREVAAVAGWEGLILRRRLPYKGRRSKDVVKVKTFETLEARVRGTDTGEVLMNIQGRERKVRAMTSVWFNYKGTRVDCGSGFSKEERLRYLYRPDEIVGQLISVQYFGVTTDSKTGLESLRFPTFRGVVGRTREV